MPPRRSPQGPPGHTALYRIFDASDELLYVGISDQLGTRLSDHARESEWWPDAARIEVVWWSSRRQAEAAETAAIHAEVPAYNVSVGLVGLDWPGDLFCEVDEAGPDTSAAITARSPFAARLAEAVALAERRAAIAADRLAGMSIRQIADRHRVSPGTVQKDLAHSR